MADGSVKYLGLKSCMFHQIKLLYCLFVGDAQTKMFLVILIWYHEYSYIYIYLAKSWHRLNSQVEMEDEELF